MDPFLAVVLFLAALIAVLTVGAMLLNSIVNPKVDTHEPQARAIIDNPDYRWTDVLQSHRSQIRFDPEKRVMCLLTVNGPPQLVSFSDVRRWSYAPLPSRNGRQYVGYRLSIATNNAANPISFLDIYANDSSAADIWMAKLSAHING